MSLGRSGLAAADSKRGKRRKKEGLGWSWCSEHKASDDVGLIDVIPLTWVVRDGRMRFCRVKQGEEVERKCLLKREGGLCTVEREREEELCIVKNEKKSLQGGDKGEGKKRDETTTTLLPISKRLASEDSPPAA